MTKEQRMYIRAMFSVIYAIATGALPAPDFIPIPIHHDIQQALLWVVSMFMIVNPIMHWIGNDDGPALPTEIKK